MDKPAEDVQAHGKIAEPVLLQAAAMIVLLAWYLIVFSQKDALINFMPVIAIAFLPPVAPLLPAMAQLNIV